MYTTRHSFRPVAIILASALALVLSLVHGADAGPPTPGVPVIGGGAAGDESSASGYEFANCRFGVSVRDTQLEHFSPVPKLNVGWYLDFSAHPPLDVPAEYVPMVRIHQDRGGSDDCNRTWGFSTTPALTEDGLGQLVDRMPGTRWIVGNEPERMGQDGICPKEYAQAYHDVYHFIKGRDPTAQIVAGGTVLVSSMRLSYLDIVWDAYLRKYGEPMPVDIWAVHMYVLSETGSGDAHVALGTDPALGVQYSGNCSDQDTFCHAEHDEIELFYDEIVSMRQWMKNHGYQNRPLIITEYGILKPYHLNGTCSLETCLDDICFCDEQGVAFHPARVRDFAIETFDVMRTAASADIGYPLDGNRLVQQWLWFSVATSWPTGIGHAGNLTDPYTTGPDGEWALTAIGQGWQNYVRQISPEPNLFVTDVPTVNGIALGEACSAEATLVAHVVNNGNVAPGGAVSATFYSDESLRHPIGTGTFPPLQGCASETTVVMTTWSGLCAGTHRFWVRVDDPETVTEANELDNVGTGIVVIQGVGVGRPLYLPAIMRAF